MNISEAPKTTSTHVNMNRLGAFSTVEFVMLLSLAVLGLSQCLVCPANAAILSIENSSLAPQRDVQFPLLTAKSTLTKEKHYSSKANIALSSYQGKVVLLDFWASWCAPCKQSFPWMNTMQARYQQQGLVVVAINVDVKPNLAVDFLIHTPAEFDILLDTDANLQQAFRVQGMPTSFLLDRQGRVRARHIGFSLEKTTVYEADIKQLLDEK